MLSVYVLRLQGQSRVDLELMQGRFRIDLKSIWLQGQSGIDLGSIWGRSGVDSESIWKSLGVLLAQIGGTGPPAWRPGAWDGEQE